MDWLGSAVQWATALNQRTELWLAAHPHPEAWPAKAITFIPGVIIIALYCVSEWRRLRGNR